MPFKTERILSLNPRLKNAQKLLANDEVQLLQNQPGYVEALVKGSRGLTHKVVMEGEQQRCTCDWYTKYQGKRGICKHVLVVKMMMDRA